MSAHVELKKTLQVKTKALSRLNREYLSYLQEYQSYDMHLVSQNKRQLELYQESKAALAQVQQKIVQFYHGLKSYVFQKEVEMKQDMEEDYNNAQILLQKVSAQFPALC